MREILKYYIVCAVFLVLGFSSSIQAAVKGAAKPNTSGQGGGVLQATGQTQAPKGTPTWEIQEIERRLEEYDTSPNTTAAQQARNSQIKREILNGTFDLRELSRLALDKNWNNLSGGEQNNFVSLMTDLLTTKAIFSKEQSKTQGKSYLVSYKGDRYLENNQRAQTLTQIYVPKENISVDIEYKLKQSGKGWKVYDIVVDGASLVENYRYQFNSIITKHGYPELVTRMRSKLNELQSGKD